MKDRLPRRAQFGIHAKLMAGIGVTVIAREIAGRNFQA